MSNQGEISKPRGRPENPDARKERRELILRGARTCFIEKGFDGASISEVAAKSGVSVANIYQYFDSKESLIHALIAHNLKIDLNKIRLMNDTKYDKSRLRNFMRDAFTNPEHVDAVRLFQEILAEATRSPKVAELTQETERKSGIAVMEGIEQAQAARNISPSVDPRDAARKISYFHNGLVARLAIQPSLGKRLADQFTDFILEVVNPQIE